MSEQSTEALRQSLVESFMAIVGAPDDPEVAEAADRVVRELDARLAAES
ncbi:MULTISPECIES: hypothetical protein [Kitasatospora]|uniref:Uncharacterized protein n=1 Tax=Kitasatospora setae (strain ATCC 33774 / DSM 43861 / JCM 3304 / KCC A-0304 / NBRC 14216 / KM-6054) TaxID=452652 RepID=E4NBH6_KITSK|nr:MULTISPECIES: hypothetical protein [Kitasatospora]BAJ28557.1 hypothetical protein KSE_27450 [Kitasatospora setae KM-6054]